CSDPLHPHIYTLSLHDALPISLKEPRGVPVHLRPHLAILSINLASVLKRPPLPGPLLLRRRGRRARRLAGSWALWGLARISQLRSEEHTSELQSRSELVCRLLL